MYEKVDNFKIYLEKCEKSELTVEKYIRDILAFANWNKGEVTKETVLEYKTSFARSICLRVLIQFYHHLMLCLCI